ncbi:hypothetical protein VNI00_019465 [Paramarasmius palmivorus]|uniref:CxC2-like cysteine cluster KDZ transposase-associated domain-containing protein n=1 Tax=Paramarasmius palmivorus TaxID=297713 RepID=A0AAW0AKP8_9AGAR
MASRRKRPRYDEKERYNAIECVSDDDEVVVHDISDTGFYTSSYTVPMPQPPVFHEVPNDLKTPATTEEDPDIGVAEADGIGDVEVDPEVGASKEDHGEQTQRQKLLEAYMEKLDQASFILMHREAHAMINRPCSCHRAGHLCLVRCLDCDQAPLLCPECWTDMHRYQPLHWAHVWDTSRGYFKRQDISTFGYRIVIGHPGHEPCTNGTDGPLNIIDVNGIHATRVRYCRCEGPPDKWKLLLQNGFFPGSVKDPQTAFTTRVLRHYQIINLQSKMPIYQYMKVLRRLTDNVFTGNVPEVVKQFTLVMRLWSLMEAKRRAGHLHNMDSLFPCRNPNSLVVYCPCCPEREVNLDPEWKDTPNHLMHLHQSRFTIDGNYQANHILKKGAKTDTYLWRDNGYFENADDYDRLCGFKEPDKTEKSVCGHLGALNKQNRAKFKNTDISGIVNVQCDHIFVLASGNLKLGERYIAVDRVVARALHHRQFGDGEEQPPITLSYDAMCSYCVNLPARWDVTHPELKHLLRHMRFVIPICHCRNHIDSCEPLYLYVYKDGVGWFPAETAEMYWPILNATGAACRQMNLGPREEGINMSHGDWNWRKVVGISHQLYKDLNERKAIYIEKRDHFAALCRIFASKVKVWNSMDRSPQVINRQNVQSVYMHSSEKGPTLHSLVDEMKRSREEVQTPLGNSRIGAVASYLLKGLDIHLEQEEVSRLARKYRDRPWEDLKGLLAKRAKLQSNLEKFREHQEQILPGIFDELHTAVCEPEEERLCLPSDFSAEERYLLKLSALATKEVKLLRARLDLMVHALRVVVRIYSAAILRKIDDSRGQVQNTRSNQDIASIREERDQLIQNYASLRERLRRLEPKDMQRWPELTVADTYRKPTEQRRVPGMTRVHEGSLWKLPTQSQGRKGNKDAMPVGSIRGDMVMLEGSAQHVEGEDGEPFCDVESFNYSEPTWNPENKRGKKKINEEVIEAESDEGITVKDDGWIWNPGQLQRMTGAEMKDWEETSDRVQWFRAEAEFERAREEVEIKHAEFARCIRFFACMRDKWTTCAEQSAFPGHAAYAREHSDIYDALRQDAEAKFSRCSIPMLRTVPSGKTLADQVIAYRAQEEKYFDFDRQVGRPLFQDPTMHGTPEGFRDYREDVDS